jgi:hypothetical protein
MRHLQTLRSILFALLLFPAFILTIPAQEAQGQQVNSSLFRLAEGFVRIAEPGQLADTLNVWGDVNAPGRYIVPRGTKVHEMISYARGMTPSRGTGLQNLDWSKLRVVINVSSNVEGEEQVQSYIYRYDEPFPEELRQLALGNDDILSVEVKRRPSFVDWLQVTTSVLGATATTIIILDRLSE